MTSPSEVVVNAGFGSVALMNRGPHPNAARVFLNWLLGREAQQAWALADQTHSRRLDVAPGSPETKLDPQRWSEYVNVDRETNVGLRLEVNKLVDSILK